MNRKIYYSATERAFLFSDVHGEKSETVPDPDWVRPYIGEGEDAILDEDAEPPLVEIANPRYPPDAVEVSAADYAALMEAQAAPNWSTIEPDENGAPQVVPASDERLGTFIRMKRDTLLAGSDVLVLPDRWAGYSPEKQAAVAAYRQALRDLPDQPGFPRNVELPEVPK